MIRVVATAPKLCRKFKVLRNSHRPGSVEEDFFFLRRMFPYNSHCCAVHMDTTYNGKCCPSHFLSIPLLVLLLIMCRWLNVSSLFLLTSVFNVHVWSSAGWGVEERGGGGFMVHSGSESLALLQALRHLHSRVCCCCRRLSTEEGCGSLRLVPLDFFAWRIERDARDEKCYTLSGF